MALTSSSLCRSALVVFTLFLWSCASSPELDMVLGESPLGTVYLERIPNRSFQAAHPIKIDHETVARVLTGILVKEDQGLLRNLMTGQPSIAPAFTDEEVRYLAPLIADGFARAAPDQQVGFRLIQAGSGLSQSVGAAVGSSEPSRGLSLMETSRGSLYAYGRSLYVSISEYRVRSERADTINMANRRVPDATGLMNRTLSFTPESARRPDSYRGRNSNAATLVIDYALLATLLNNATPPANQAGLSPGSPPPAAPPRSTDSETDSQLRVLQEQMRQKNQELEELRKELQDIRRHLTEPSRRP